MNRRSQPCYVRAFFFASLALLASSIDAKGQSDSQASSALALFAGDSVRVNGSVVGRVLSVEGNYFTLISRGKPLCRAGQMHGDAPICDPAPMQRQTLALDEVSLERRATKSNQGLWTFGGAALGTAVFGALGYAIGPSVGFGKVDSCTAEGTDTYCLNPVSREQLDAEQTMRDQRRGAFFFGLVGGTFTAIMARKFTVGWVRIDPTVPARAADGWGMSFTVPSN
ncbi:MAG: hypothetical protein L7S64_12925 [Longimicrobiales bacterium]|nr:hypothetical protein [Longimicrobiales bacterium]